MKSPSSVPPCAPEYRHRGLLRRARRERISLGSLTKVRVREKAHYGVHKLWRRGALHPELRIGVCVRRLFAQLETTVTPGIGSSSEVHSLRFNSPIATRSTEGDASRVQSQKRLSPQPLEST